MYRVLFLYAKYEAVQQCQIASEVCIPFDEIQRDAMELLATTYFGEQEGIELETYLHSTDLSPGRKSPVRYVSKDYIVTEMAPNIAIEAFNDLEYSSLLINALKKRRQQVI